MTFLIGGLLALLVTRSPGLLERMLLRRAMTVGLLLLMAAAELDLCRSGLTAGAAMFLPRRL